MTNERSVSCCNVRAASAKSVAQMAAASATLNGPENTETSAKKRWRCPSSRLNDQSMAAASELWRGDER